MLRAWGKDTAHKSVWVGRYFAFLFKCKFEEVCLVEAVLSPHSQSQHQDCESVLCTREGICDTLRMWGGAGIREKVWVLPVFRASPVCVGHLALSCLIMGVTGRR